MAILLLITNVITVALFLLALHHIRRYRRDKRIALNLWDTLPVIPLQQLDPIFKRTALGPTLASEVVFISAGDGLVPGATSDFEAAILATLAKTAHTMFEFGTCTGRTTYLWARNSPSDAKVITITLHPNDIASYTPGGDDQHLAELVAVDESSFDSFYYSGTDVEHKVEQLFGDSKKCDYSAFAGKCDLIFVDGSHAYSYVKSDSENALKMLAPNGIILWHDFRGPESDTRDVNRYLMEFAIDHTLYRIKGTSFVVFRNA